MRPKQGTAIFFRAIMLQRKMMTIGSHVRVDVSASGPSLMIHSRGNPVRWGRSRKNIRDQAFVISFKRSEEHTSELQSLMRISYAVFCLKKKTPIKSTHIL